MRSVPGEHGETEKRTAKGDGAGFYDDKGNWVDLEWGDRPKETGLDAAKVRIIGIGTGLSILLAGAAYYIATDNGKPPIRREIQKKEEVVSSGMRHFRKGVKVDTTRVATVWYFSKDILKLD